MKRPYHTIRPREDPSARPRETRRNTTAIEAELNHNLAKRQDYGLSHNSAPDENQGLDRRLQRKQEFAYFPELIETKLRHSLHVLRLAFERVVMIVLQRNVKRGELDEQAGIFELDSDRA